MWPFTRVPKPSPKRLVELEDELSDVVIQLAWTKKQIVDLNARFATIQRAILRDERERLAAETPDEDVQREDLSAPPRFPLPRPVESTAHLARRFKGF